MEKNYSMEIVNAIKDFLDDGGIKYDFFEEHGVYKFGSSVKSKIKRLDLLISVNDDEYFCFAISPFNADADCMAEMSRFLHKANYGLKRGNFEFDDSDGEIRFKYYVDCEDCMPPSFSAVAKSILLPTRMIERYGDGIVGIIFGGMTAEEAIKLCDKNED